MRIGLLGGTFNPIHNGHLHIAEEVRKSCQLDQVWFLPTWQPPHKEVATDVSFADRLAMVAAAVADHPDFFACDLEGQRGGISFSVETLTELREKYPDHEFFFIMGLDSFREISQWHRYQELFELAHIVVTTRPGFEGTLQELLPVAIADRFCYDSQSKKLRFDKGFSLILVDHTSYDISSTQIRQWVAQQRSIDEVVPPAVSSYIATHQLYV
ncbi:MAG: nicotinate-nucleotide adenylyltransferase [Pelovirga sp.]